MRKARLTLAGLALGAGIHGCACEGGGEPDASLARLPCGAVGQWSDGAIEQHRFTYANRELAAVRIRDGAGAILRDETRGFDGEQLAWTERGGVRDEYRYDGTRLIRITRTDRTPDDGDESAIATYGWAGDAIVSQDLEFTDPARPDRHATITGDRTERLTIVDCLAVDPAACETWVFEQPDAEPARWTLATVDRDGDGNADARFQRTLDERGLELAFVETELSPRGPVVRTRVTTTRATDGTALGSVREQFAADGSPLASLQLVHDFACTDRSDQPDPGARPAQPVRRGADDLGLVARLLDR